MSQMEEYAQDCILVNSVVRAFERKGIKLVLITETTPG